ncbi:platelet-activating factor receptor [Varanus komodoensis]|uniref:Platelet-activating factor receptor n=1 Tax=Varanus komodoensis TaxID=61221 RepID=A0A8D2KS74_VARKO|nr:platelet-activating factor receptor [Varanus komodoensis]XP_044290903.1 platelet-activating factor receptor [Varanus komodoensis]XP_044290904.1 platelet-activating factor receptor [Varanus komodoensis]XP_044290906.1 platelet-activating factor receptor [Varanus komodoensis]XP_044290907.1 platelet-activating factor receptor [Varanus komodoensis]
MTTLTPIQTTNNSALPLHSSECSVDSEFRYNLFTVYYSIIFILGFIANTYVLWLFTRVYATKKLNEIKIFMVNLTTADLLFLVTLPMWIVYYHNKGNWIMPNFLCNIAGYLFFVNTYCSVAFLGVITYNRYQAVTKPISTAQSSTRRRGIYITVAIWVLICVPSTYFLFDEGITQEEHVKRCFERYDTKGNTTPVLAVHVIICLCFFITFLIVLVCNVHIIRTLLSQPLKTQKSARVRQRAFWLVCTVFTVFILCFVPHHLVDLPWTLMVLEKWKMGCSAQKILNDTHQITLFLLGANCVLDPIIYCFLTKKFRKHLSENLKNIKDSRKCSKQTTETAVEGVIPLEEYLHTSFKS